MIWVTGAVIAFVGFFGLNIHPSTGAIILVIGLIVIWIGRKDAKLAKEAGGDLRTKRYDV